VELWMGTMIWHFRQQFGNKLSYVRQWSSKTSWHRRNAPMTSFFDDVNLHWRAVETLWSANSRQILMVLGNFEPLNVVGHCSDPKRHTLASFCVFWAIARQNPLTGHFSIGEPEKKIQIFVCVLYFTYLARRSLTTDWYKFRVTCSSHGRNQLCKVSS